MAILAAGSGEAAGDRELIEAAKTSPAAFARLYDHYFDRIYNYAYYRMHNHEAAEDVAAETFKRALEGIGRFEWKGIPFSAWLYRVAGNVIAMHYRKHVPEDPIEDHEFTAPDDEGPEYLMERVENVDMLRRLMSHLTEEQRQAVVLKFGQGLRNGEIAEVMDRSEGAVKLLLHRGLRAMQKRMTQEGAQL